MKLIFDELIKIRVVQRYNILQAICNRYSPYPFRNFAVMSIFYLNNRKGMIIVKIR